MGNKKQSFMEGALILMVAGVIVKIIGAIFKIPLYNLIGGQSMSYFNVAYDVYTTMYVITTAGLPTAISRLVSESNGRGRYKNSNKILKVTVTSLFGFGVLCSAVAFFGADWMAVRFFANPHAAPAIKVIAPAIMFEVIMSSYRGFFQGNKNMVPTAISQIITAVSKLGLGFVVAVYILNLGLPAEQALPFAAAGAISGVTAGTIFGSIFLMIRKTFYKIENEPGVMEDTRTDPALQLFKNLLSISIPVAIGSSVLSIANIIDTSMIIKRLLVSGQGQAMAETLFGAYTGMARTMSNLPTALIVPIGMSVVPVISEKIAASNVRGASDIMASSLRMTTLFSMPAGFGFIFMSQPILMLLYGARPDEVIMAAPLLALLGPSVVLICLVTITNPILQASGNERVPVFTLLAGGIVKIITTFFLVANPKLNIYGAPFSTLMCYGTAIVLNFIIIKRITQDLPSLPKLFFKPLVASFLACGTARLCYNAMSGVIGGNISTVVCIGIAALLYFVLIIVMKGIQNQDVLMLPKGDKILGIMQKLGWKGE